MYDVPDIIGELTKAEGLPRAALKAASERRNELVGRFLAEIERALAAPGSAPPKGNLVFFAFHLLGEWREAAAHKLFARLLRKEPDWLDAIFGDSITESTHRVMAAVFDGDPQPLYDIIRDTDADEFVRSRMCEVLAMLVVESRLPRQDAIDFLRETYARRNPDDVGVVWDGWQRTIAHIGATDMTPLVKEAFETELIHPSITDFGYFEQDLAYALSHPDAPWERGEEYALWGNSIAEFSTWYCFSDRYLEKRARAEAPIWEQSSQDIALALGTPPVNPLRNVGRNDPCPCGSGKKYKKCCLE